MDDITLTIDSQVSSLLAPPCVGRRCSHGAASPPDPHAGAPRRLTARILAGKTTSQLTLVNDLT
jgi:hypothetical protein